MKKALLLILALPILFGIYFYSSIDVSSLEGSYIVYDKGYKIVTEKPVNWVREAELPKTIKWAIVVSEDWAFFDHKGFDLEQIKIVIRESFESQKLTRGASTITQQVVKNAFLNNEKSLYRKLKEALGAWKLEQQFSKEKILEFYLNLIELGEGIFGIQNGAKYYFNKDAKDLNIREAAFLAMLLPNPKKYSISFKQKSLSLYAQSTIDKILVKLRQAGIITEEERLIEMDRIFSWEEAKQVESYF